MSQCDSSDTANPRELSKSYVHTECITGDKPDTGSPKGKQAKRTDLKSGAVGITEIRLAPDAKPFPMQSVKPEKEPRSGPLSSLSSFFARAVDSVYHANTLSDSVISAKPVKRTQPDITELVRTSCCKLMSSSNYVSINYDFLAEYASKLTFEDPNNHKTHITQFVTTLNAQTGISLSERDMINMTCLFVILQFGTGFTPLLATLSKGVSNALIIGDGICAIYRKYKSFDTKTLRALSIGDIGELFSAKRSNKFVIDMMYKCIQKIVLVLELKHFIDFADYVYYSIDLSWIKSQTKDLSAITTFEWEINEKSKLGLVLAPTSSKVVRRCVVTDFAPDDNTNAHNSVCRDLVQNRAFLYAINDQVLYNKPFDEVITTIRSYLKSSEEDDYKWYTVGGRRMLALQFGMHLDREPETMQTLLFNFINDFAVLNDQYLYKNLFGANKHLKVYLFQSVQSIVMELYYNCYVTAPPDQRNHIFNFKGIESLTGVVDNVIPFVFLRDGVIQINDEFQEEFDQLMSAGSLLKTSCDLETEIIASAICVMEALLNQNTIKVAPGGKMNIAILVYLLRNRGKMSEYNMYSQQYSRGGK